MTRYTSLTRRATIIPMPTQHPAADFALPDTSGHVHRLADYRGGWLLLVFHRHLA